MKVHRSLIGKPVELVWVDPIGSGKREDIAKIVKGRAGLAYWREYGVIYDVTEGVVILMHSLGYSPGDAEPDECSHTKIVDDLVTEIRVLQPVTSTQKEDEP